MGAASIIGGTGAETCAKNVAYLLIAQNAIVIRDMYLQCGFTWPEFNTN